jgi:predicted RNA-binding Zn-ribbon protein involved in translation (DUF1610 family)
MNARERDEHETTCARCGADAQWSYLDQQKRRIEIMCPNCGRYEISREEFDQAAAESAQLDESEP